jgi:hypothetical protein
MSQRPVHERRQFRLMSCTGFGKRLLKLASRRGKSNSHRVGSSLQTMAVGYGYSYLRLTIGQLESRS